ncbi:MAG: choice-of-anchor R domain-containing protein [Verrucomicrobiota bacterium]|jgi:hypothetical protein
MKTNLIKLICGLALLGVAITVPAQSLLSTLNSTPGNEWSIGADALSMAQQFTTGSQSENIGSVSVDIAYAQDGSDFTVSFYSDVSGQLGSLVSNGLLSGLGTPTSDAVNLYGASGLTLDANTTYWLVFENPVATYVYIRNTDSGGILSANSSAGWTLGDTDYKIFNGGSYSSYPNAVPLFSIDVAPVPEPATLALAGLGGLGLLLFRRRKN